MLNTFTLSNFIIYRDSTSVFCQELRSMDIAYLTISVVVQLYCQFVHGTGGFLAHFEFLPLLLTSVSCSVGLLCTWLLSYSMYIFQ